MMPMSFWWDYKVSDYLFKGLTTTSIGGLIAICICTAIMSFTFEFLRYLQARHRQKELTLRSEQLKTICPNETSNLLTQNQENDRPTVNITKMHRSILIGSDISLWFLLQNLGYILMLSVMKYNGWIFVSAVVGGGAGYFVFGQMFMKINLQNCQIIRDTWCMQKCGETEASATADGESTPALEAASTSQTGLDCHQVTYAECH